MEKGDMPPPYEEILRGKLAYLSMVRGKDDIFQRFTLEIDRLVGMTDPEVKDYFSGRHSTETVDASGPEAYSRQGATLPVGTRMRSMSSPGDSFRAQGIWPGYVLPCLR